MASAAISEDFIAKYTVRTSFRGQEVKLLQTPREKGEDGSDNTGWAVWEASNILLRWVAHDDNVTYAMRSASSPQIPPYSWNKLRMLDLSAGAGLVALAAAAAGAASVAASDIPAQLEQLKDNILRSGFEVAEQCEDITTAVLGGVSASEVVNPSQQEGVSRTTVRVIPYYWGESVNTLRPRGTDDSKTAETSASSSSHENVGSLLTEGTSRETTHDPLLASIWYDLVFVSDILFIAIRDNRTVELEATIRQLVPYCG